MIRKSFYSAWILLLLPLCGVITAQTPPTLPVQQPFISVTGSASVELQPSEVHLVVRIQEYYQEELEGKERPEELKTKIPLSTIERELKAKLRFLRIADSSITMTNVGNRWRKPGRDLLLAKDFDIKLSSYAEAERLADNLQIRGIESIFIGEVKSKNMAEMREYGKIQALLAARRKADALVRAVGKRLGDVLSIEEPVEYGVDIEMEQATAKMANMMLQGGGGGTNTKFPSLTLRYSMRATFKIVD